MKQFFLKCLFFCASFGAIQGYASSDSRESFATLEEDYTPKYCLQLEAAYGKGLMSEGGEQGIEHMFDSISLEKKVALDIGSGLGGVAFHLAEKYDMSVTGLEVNSWMVSESKKRTPKHLDRKVDFVLSTSNNHLPLPQDNYDIIYSKGVLTHVEVKDGLFQECHRLLKKEGLLVINDWLSFEGKAWGENIARLVELENLALYPESESGYIALLQKNGFTLLSVRDDTVASLSYNRDIVNRLRDPARRQDLLNSFDEKELEDAIVGYEAIAQALEMGELRVLRFIAQKN